MDPRNGPSVAVDAYRTQSSNNQPMRMPVLFLVYASVYVSIMRPVLPSRPVKIAQVVV